MEKLIKATNIHKSFEDLEILKGIDIEIAKGEVVSIVGSSGAGKTTLLQILGTLDKPNKGEIIIAGQDINRLNEKKLSRFRNKHIGFIFQFHQLLPEFTALENACIPAFISGLGKNESLAKGEDLLKLLGLKDRMDHKPQALSGGEQQRVAVARALINNPSVIFADEPSGNLDSKNSDELHQLFFKLREELGQTFLIVTHHNDFAAMADRMLVMEDGKIVGS